MTMDARGTRGYADHADELIAEYDAIGFEERHAPVMSFIPAAPATMLDVGAGTGVDARWLAGRGHDVVAVEPTAAFREHGRRTFSPRIEWIDDCLPHLERVRESGRRFDAILATAVWMHLDERERAAAMPVVASLLAPGGVAIMTLRHGPVPQGRIMYEVAPEEPVAAARACGLGLLLQAGAPAIQAASRAAGVHWTHLVFRRPGPL